MSGKSLDEDIVRIEQVWLLWTWFCMVFHHVVQDHGYACLLLLLLLLVLVVVVVLVLVMLVEVVGVDADDPSQTRRRICNITVIASGVHGISRCCLMNDEIVCWLSNLFFRPPSFPNSPALLASRRLSLRLLRAPPAPEIMGEQCPLLSSRQPSLCQRLSHEHHA